jgi:hypothetical protein
MNEFTLFTVFNAVKKHFLVTIVLFGLTYWLIPDMNLIENRYSMEKTIIEGEAANGYTVNLLTYSNIHAIINSANTRNFLGNKLGGSMTQFQVYKNDEKNIILALKGYEPDHLVNTARLIIERLQEFDELEIQKQTALIDEDIAVIRKSRQILLLSDENFEVNNSDIEEYVSKQKNYDLSFTPFDVDRQTNSDIFGLTRLKREDAARRLNDELKVIEIEQNILKLEGLIEAGKKVSYLFPAELKDINKYYPTDILFFGISLLTAFFYNLIMLNFLYIKYKKSV